MATIRSEEPPLLYGCSNEKLKLASQIQFSSANTSEVPYVLYVAPLPQGYLFGLSDDTLRAVSPDLRETVVLPSTQKGISSLTAGKLGNGECVVFVTANDGSVVCWKQGAGFEKVFEIRNKERQGYLCASQSVDGGILAVGTLARNDEGSIDLWDLKTMSLMYSYSPHNDDVTTLAFHPIYPHILLSGSVDGVLNTYDIRIADEDEAGLGAFQVGVSVSSGGWMNLAEDGEKKGVWTLTTIETVQIWDGVAGDMISNLGDVREVALQPWRTDYTICGQFETTLDTLYLICGTQKGDVAVMNVKDTKKWVMEQHLPGVGGRTLGGNGHSDIVRCAYMNLAVSARD